MIDLAKGDIIPPPHQTQSQVLSRALARLPDPLYISADLYAQQTQNDTWYYNTSGLVAVSTILGLLAVGASTRAIVSELLLQYKTLTSNGEQTAIVQSLIDDYISLAKYEEKHQTFPGWGAVASKFTPHVEPAGSGGTSSSVHAPTTNSAAAATVEKFLMRYLGGHR